MSFLHPRMMRSLAAFFPQTCTIERALAGVDVYGADTEQWEAHATEIPCRLVIKAERNPLTEVAENPLITSVKLMLPQALDVTTRDRIVEVRGGEAVEPGPFRILQVMPRGMGPHAGLTLELEHMR
jgi:hypothetical protein